jgi:hypothetical protein
VTVPLVCTSALSQPITRREKYPHRREVRRQSRAGGASRAVGVAARALAVGADFVFCAGGLCRALAARRRCAASTCCKTPRLVVAQAFE